MSQVSIVTDTTASIPEEILQRLNIHTAAYYIHRGREVLIDLVTIQRENFYQWMQSASVLPKTACPGPGDYLSLYKRLIFEKGVNKILSIHMTAKGSGAYDSACTAQSLLKEELPAIQLEVLDTENVAMAHGWMVIEAARAALRGVSLAAVKDVVEKMKPITRMIQTADTLKYLYMGGRIGRAQHMLGSLLRIKPLISMREGVIVALGQTRSRARAYEKMADIIAADVGEEGRIKIAYMHAAAREEVEKIKVLIEDRFDVVESFFCELSPALGVHTGPGTAGVCYFPV